MRSDGTWFRVGIVLHAEKVRKIEDQEVAIKVALSAVEDALAQLDSYRNCGCVVSRQCPTHRVATT